MKNQIIKRGKKKEWTSMPLPSKVKDLLIGRTCFSKEDLAIINKKDGFYTIIPKTYGRAIDQINQDLALIPVDRDKNFYEFTIK